MNVSDHQYAKDEKLINDDVMHNLKIVEVKSCSNEWDHVLTEQDVNTIEIPTTLKIEENSCLEKNELNCSNSWKNVSFSESKSILYYSELQATNTLHTLIPEVVVVPCHSPYKPEVSFQQIPKDNIFKTLTDAGNSQASPETINSENCSAVFTSSNNKNATNFEFRKRNKKGRFIKTSKSRRNTCENKKKITIQSSECVKMSSSEQNKIDSVNSFKCSPIEKIISKNNYSNGLFDKYPCVHLEKLNLPLIHAVKNNSSASQPKKNLETNLSCKKPKLSEVDICISQIPNDVAHLSESDEIDSLSVTNTHNINEEFAEKCCHSVVDKNAKEKNDWNPNLEMYSQIKEAVVLLERLNLPIYDAESTENAARIDVAPGGNTNSNSFSGVDDKMRESESFMNSREIIIIPKSKLSKKSNSAKKNAKTKSSVKKKMASISAASFQKSVLGKDRYASVFQKGINKKIKPPRQKKNLQFHGIFNKNELVSPCLANYCVPATLESTNLFEYKTSDINDDSSFEVNLSSYLQKQNNANSASANLVQSFSKLNSNDDAENESTDDDVPLIHLKGDNPANSSKLLKVKSKNLQDKHHLNSMTSNYENDLLLSHVEEVSSGPSTSHAYLDTQVSASEHTENSVNNEFQVCIPTEIFLKKILLDHSYPVSQKNSNLAVTHATLSKSTKTSRNQSKNSTVATSAKLIKKGKIVSEKAHKSKKSVQYDEKSVSKRAHQSKKSVQYGEKIVSKKAHQSKKTVQYGEKIVSKKAHQNKKIVKHGKKVSNQIVTSQRNTTFEEDGVSKKALRKKQAEVYEMLLKYLKKEIKSTGSRNKLHKTKKVKKHKKIKLQSVAIDSDTESNSSLFLDSSSEEVSSGRNNFFSKGVTLFSQPGVASSSGYSQKKAKSSKKRNKSLDKYRLGFLSKKRTLRLHNKCLASERFLFSKNKLNKKKRKKMKKMLKIFNEVFSFGTE